MQFKLQLVAHDDNGQADDVIDIAVFDKVCEQVGAPAEGQPAAGCGS
jgi:hypothetical protein